MERRYLFYRYQEGTEGKEGKEGKKGLQICVQGGQERYLVLYMYIHYLLYIGKEGSFFYKYIKTFLTNITCIQKQKQNRRVQAKSFAETRSLINKLLWQEIVYIVFKKKDIENSTADRVYI